MGRLLLCTPAQLWSHALSRQRMTPSQFDPGAVNDVVHTGTGLGRMRVADLPYDAYVVEARVVQSGDTVGKVGSVTATATGTGRIEVQGVPRVTGSFRVQITAAGNLGAASWRWSDNGGATWSLAQVLPTLQPVSLAGTGLSLYFYPGQGPTYFAAGDEWRFSAVAPAKITVSAFNIATPIGRCSTGTITPSGPALARDLTIDVCIYGGGTLGEATFIYSVNGSAASVPQVVPGGGTFLVPNTGITLTFDPGPGSTYYAPGDSFRIISRGVVTVDITDKPMALQRPEPTGLQLIFEPTSAASPQFVAGDVYSVSTGAPADVLEVLYGASDEAMAELRSRYRRQTILAWDTAVMKAVAVIAREALYERKGFNQDEDFRIVQTRAKEARAWFNAVGKKMKHPCIVATPIPGILAPRVVQGPDDTQIMDGPYGPEDSSARRRTAFWLLGDG